MRCCRDSRGELAPLVSWSPSSAARYCRAPSSLSLHHCTVVAVVFFWRLREGAPWASVCCIPSHSPTSGSVLSLEKLLGAVVSSSSCLYPRSELASWMSDWCKVRLFHAIWLRCALQVQFILCFDVRISVLCFSRTWVFGELVIWSWPDCMGDKIKDKMGDASVDKLCESMQKLFAQLVEQSQQKSKQTITLEPNPVKFSGPHNYFSWSRHATLI